MRYDHPLVIASAAKQSSFNVGLDCFAALAMTSDMGLSNWHEFAMVQTQQSFRNDKETPIYISVEPWPECFELEPGEKLTVIWDAPDEGDVAETHFVNDRELVVHPNGPLNDIWYFINGEPAKDRSWQFKHK